MSEYGPDDLYAPNQQVVRRDASGPAEEGTGGSGEGPVTDAGFDPAEHTVSEVQEYVDAHPEERDSIRADEEQGKARVTLLDWFDETG